MNFCIIDYEILLYNIVREGCDVTAYTNDIKREGWGMLKTFSVNLNSKNVGKNYTRCLRIITDIQYKYDVYSFVFKRDMGKYDNYRIKKEN